MGGDFNSYLVFNGFTQMSLLTLSTTPATEACSFSSSIYVPCPLKERSDLLVFEIMQKSLLNKLPENYSNVKCGANKAAISKSCDTQVLFRLAPAPKEEGGKK